MQQATYVIETDVPLPSDMSRGRHRELPYLELEPGHSFASSRYVDVNRFKAPSDWQYICRKQPTGGWRVWRIK